MTAMHAPHQRPLSCLRQVPAFLAAIRRIAPNHFAYIFLDLMTGMRPSEISAIKWCDIDEEEGVLKLSRGQWRGYVGMPKTGKVRHIPLTPEMLEVLREHRKQMLRQQHPGLASGLVFPSDTGGYHYSSWADKVLKKAIRECGIPHRVTMQGLRRTCNNIQRRLGIEYCVIQSCMGHSSDAMTEHYSTVGLDERKEAARRLMSVVTGTETGPTNAPKPHSGEGGFGVFVGVGGSALTGGES